MESFTVALPDISATSLLALLVMVIIMAQSITRRRQRLPLPPGPKGLPIIGNLLDMPRVRPWLLYHEWAKQFESDLVFLQMQSQPIIIVDTIRAATDLMEKRARKYSDKPISVMDKLTGWDWNLAIVRYGSRWRITRRYVHQYFYPGAIKQYWKFEIQEVHAFLRRALHSSSGINYRSVHQIFASLTLDIIYGTRVQNMDDEYILRMEKGGECFGKSKVPGAFWIDSFPLMRHVPAWFPGASAKKYGARFKSLVLSLKDEPYDAIKQEMAAGVDKERVAHKLAKRVERYMGTGELYREHDICARNAAGIAYVGEHMIMLAISKYPYERLMIVSWGRDAWFLLAMAMHPEVQVKAQRELDAVLGSRRLPDHDDLASLPYCHAILLETLRWRAVVPLGIAHRVMEEDEYQGRRIPEGSIIIPNAWAMLHDPVDYPDPIPFNPDRFLKDGQIDPEVRDPSTIVFGFGRRICPGRYFAKDMLFLAIASILSVYDIRPVLDDNGVPYELHAESPGSGILLYPSNLYQCAMKPRSAVAERLIKATDWE